MSFEFSFPDYLIGKCLCSFNNGCEIKTKKVSLSPKGVVFSDTIPLSWFTSSVFIPWANVQKIVPSDTQPSIDGSVNRHLSSNSNEQTPGVEYRTLQLTDPKKMTISIPWSKKFEDYVQRYELFDI